MKDRAAKFIEAKQIDSFQKLRFLLFIYQHPALTATSQDFANRLYLGDTPTLEKIITDLVQVGLLNCIENRFKLCTDPDVKSCLECLSRAFDDPLARQNVIDQVRHTATPHLPTGHFVRERYQ